MTRRSTAAALLAVLTALLLAGCSSSPSPSQPSDLNDNTQAGPYQGFGLVPPQPRPQFTLLDTANKPFAFGQRTQGHPTFLFFGYTHCPNECPATMADVQGALRSVPKDVAADSDVVFVTTDPKRDTGAVMATWLKQFSTGTTAHWIGLHGSQAQIDTAQAAAHVMIAQDGGETHSTELLLYGPDDYAHVSFLQTTNEQQQIAHDLPVVADKT